MLTRTKPVHLLAAGDVVRVLIFAGGRLSEQLCTVASAHMHACQGAEEPSSVVVSLVEYPTASIHYQPDEIVVTVVPDHQGAPEFFDDDFDHGFNDYTEE